MKAVIQVLGENGYVWDAAVAHWLRLECGLVGAMVGGVAAFKQQNAVHGLPLELSPEEVTLAVEKGWAELLPALLTAEQAALLGGGSNGGRKRGRQQYSGHYGEELVESDGDDGYGGSYGGQGGYADMDTDQQQQEPAWRAALAEGAAFTVPTTAAEAAAANACGDADAAAGGARVSAAGAAEAPPAAATAAHADAVAVQEAAEAAEAGAAPEAAPAAGEPAAAGEPSAAAGEAVRWVFPASEGEQHRYWVFRDLHSKGYRLTGGSKFGADFLVYPGDPTLYHAQFCVRLMPFGQPILPAMLASATRGSHQARKHLLIASVVMAGAGGEGDDGSSGGNGGSGEDEAMGGAPQAAEGAVPAAAGQAAAEGAAAAPTPQQQQPIVSGDDGGVVGQPQLGANSGRVGSSGERYRIHYMTIGPVEGFG